jgi:hypothetical protein
MVSKLSLYRGALRILRQPKVDTVTDDVLARYELDDEYDKCMEYMLEAGLWNFAMRTVAVTSDSNLTPAFGYQYGFEKPSDWVRTARASNNPQFYPLFEDDEYVDETDYWYASVDPFYVSYVSNGASYGLDLTRWPASFERAFEHELAVRVSPNITTLSAEERKDYILLAKRALSIAQSKDAMNQAPTRRNPGRLIRARRGNRFGSLRDR